MKNNNNFIDKKAHRNGIRKVQRKSFASTKGMDRKFLKNQRYARLGTIAALKA